MNTTTKTIAEIVSETFNFEVNKFPLSGPDKMSTPCYGLFRSDNSEFVGSGNNAVTQRYLPHTTDDVLVLVEAAQTVFPGEHEVKCYWNDGHYVNVMPSREHRKAIFGTNDNVFPRLIVRAGYDQKPFNGSLGMYRDVCKNLSIPRSVQGYNVSVRHTSGLRKRMKELIDQFSALASGWERLGEVIDQMQRNEVVLANFLDSIYPLGNDATSREITIHKNRTRDIVNRVINERQKTGRPAFTDADIKISGWEAYNAVQGFVQWDATRKSGTTDWNRILMASNDRSVIKAEELALVG